jgi:hypothetical protein
MKRQPSVWSTWIRGLLAAAFLAGTAQLMSVIMK